MSLLMCRPEPVNHPYYIEVLGIHLYSSQELCYVIFNNPLLVLEDFVDPSLIHFIGEELGMTKLAGKLKQLSDAREGEELKLLLILTECDYYTEYEIGRFKQVIAGLKKLHPAEYAKRAADYLFEKKQYGKAAQRYEKLLDYPRDKTVGDAFLGEVSYSLGAAWAQMFQFERAYKALDQSYGLTKSQDTLKRIYYLTVFEPALAAKERYRPLFTPALKEAWDQELALARQGAQAAREVAGLRELFRQDEQARLSGAEEMIGRWKREYRLMI